MSATTTLPAALGERLRDTRLVIVANREPYIHAHETRQKRGLLSWFSRTRETTAVTWFRPASGLVTALDPVMQVCGGTWIAHGSGSADRETVDSRGYLRVPPDRPAYNLRRVWLTPEEEQGYYYGAANNALWPLCPIASARPPSAQNASKQDT